MSFRQEAAKAEAATLGRGRRVLALCRCVQHYCPIGFQTTLAFLESKAGPYRQDEQSLLAAVGMLRMAHALWQSELREYGRQRRAAKLAGQRAPRRTDPNPYVLERWHGRDQEAAMFAVQRWYDGSAGHTDVDPELRELVYRALSPSFGVDDQVRLDGIRRQLWAQVTWEAYQRDSQRYAQSRKAQFIANQLRIGVSRTGRE